MRKALATLGLTAALTMALSGCTAQPSARESRPDSAISPTQSAATSPLGSWGTAKGARVDLETSWIAVYENGLFFASDGCFLGQGAWSESVDGFKLALIDSSTSEPECENSWVGLAVNMVPTEDAAVLRDENSKVLQTLPFVSSDPSLTHVQR